MKYDHPDYHWNNEFPADVPEDNALTHMGVFFAWALARGLVSDFQRTYKDMDEALERVVNREMSPRQYVITHCCSQLTNENFTEMGNGFAKAYYIQHYFDDYCKTFEPVYETIYHVEDSWGNADKLFPLLDRRLEEWIERRDRKPWWKFW